MGLKWDYSPNCIFCRRIPGAWRLLSKLTIPSWRGARKTPQLAGGRFPWAALETTTSLRYGNPVFLSGPVSFEFRHGAGILVVSNFQGSESLIRWFDVGLKHDVIHINLSLHRYQFHSEGAAHYQFADIPRWRWVFSAIVTVSVLFLWLIFHSIPIPLMMTMMMPLQTMATRMM